MKIIYKKGDLLSCDERVIVHGCNARGQMGSGVAKQIRDKYPEAYWAYIDEYHSVGSGFYVGHIIGCLIKIKPGEDKYIINAITQADYGTYGKKYVKYDGIDTAFQLIQRHSIWESFPKVLAMPKIGAGLGGGHWPVIAEIIQYRLVDIQPIVYEV
jgi:O-acetyl-ADP-ribose deacetylase (regulator of RNase III)